MQKRILCLVAACFLLACSIFSKAEEVIEQVSGQVQPAPTATEPPVEFQENVSTRDPIRVSTSEAGNHVNTVTPLNANEWALIAGTGGMFSANQTEQEELLGEGDVCYFLLVQGPTIQEYSVELTNEEDYFLAVFDQRNGPTPDSTLEFLVDIYASEDNDVCLGGIELSVVVEILVPFEENPSS